MSLQTCHYTMTSHTTIITLSWARTPIYLPPVVQYLKYFCEWPSKTYMKKKPHIHHIHNIYIPFRIIKKISFDIYFTIIIKIMLTDGAVGACRRQHVVPFFGWKRVVVRGTIVARAWKTTSGRRRLLVYMVVKLMYRIL